MNGLQTPPCAHTVSTWVSARSLDSGTRGNSRLSPRRVTSYLRFALALLPHRSGLRITRFCLTSLLLTMRLSMVSIVSPYRLFV